MEKHAIDEVSRTLASGASRRHVLRLLGGGVAVGAVAVTGLSAVAAKGKQTHAAQAGATIPIDFTSALGSFSGLFDITRFAVQQGQVVAIGTLTGTVKDATGAVVGTVDQALTLPVLPGQSSGSCQILDLVLGPLDLNLLGLVVHLDTVHLNITAQQGSGNLLGNLLCAVANLLNGNGNALGRLTKLLNQILGAL